MPSPVSAGLRCCEAPTPVQWVPGAEEGWSRCRDSSQGELRPPDK